MMRTHTAGWSTLAITLMFALAACEVETARTGGDRPAQQMIGERAPEFELAQLGGNAVNIEQHLGNDIIILDFWATWCGPCIRAMPMLIDVADRYGDKGVVFYGVNLREDPDRVQSFLAEQGWSFPVLLDSDGAVGSRYHASAIPQTVIIDREGNIAAVHIGFSPNLDAVLSNDLDALLADDDAESADPV